MKDDWIKSLKKKLERAGIDVNESHIEMFKIMETNPDRDNFANSFINIARSSTTNGQDLRSLLSEDKVMEIIHTSDGYNMMGMYYIDPDISPMLESIETDMLNNEIRWMRELT